jgi:hypothetical protein
MLNVTAKQPSGGSRRRLVLSLAFALLAAGAFASLGSGTPANAQAMKQAAGCKALAAKCKKNFERVCRQTDNKGCCVKSECVQK